MVTSLSWGISPISILQQPVHGPDPKISGRECEHIGPAALSIEGYDSQSSGFLCAMMQLFIIYFLTLRNAILKTL